MVIKKKQFYLLVAVILFLSMVFIDETGVGVTLPAIQQLFSASTLSIQWVMNAMFLPIALFLLFGGKLSDHIGYRKVFVWGCF